MQFIKTAFVMQVYSSPSLTAGQHHPQWQPVYRLVSSPVLQHCLLVQMLPLLMTQLQTTEAAALEADDAELPEAELPEAELTDPELAER